MAQYPEAQVLAADMRKDTTPAIRPHVVFINCNIFLASVDDEDRGVPGFAAIGFLIGDNGRDAVLTSRWLRGLCVSGLGLGTMDG